jgi:hypothetical protein
MLRNLWTIAAKIFVVAVVLDVGYQLIVLRWIYPVETLIVATMLALVPCMVVRACGNRIVTIANRRQFRGEQERSARSPEIQDKKLETARSCDSQTGLREDQSL